MKKITIALFALFLTYLASAQNQNTNQDVILPPYVKQGKHVFSDWQAVEKVQDTVRETHQEFYQRQKQLMEILRNRSDIASLSDAQKNIWDNNYAFLAARLIRH